jgi:tripartite ATP-independent transporter DctM subunit
MFTVDPIIPVLVIMGVMFLLLALGLPISISMGASAMLTAILFWTKGFTMITLSAWEIMTTQTFIALPMYIFMSMCLQESGIAEDMFRAVRSWIGMVPGGLAAAVIVVCTIFAAMVGSPATGTITMGLLALPIMLKLGYDKSISLGSIMAGGGLAALIPPSAVFIIYGAWLKVSVGKLFAAGLVPGLILAGLFMIYILVRCRIRPNLGPPEPKELRVGWKEKFMHLRLLIVPITLIIVVLGVIFFGIASPSESAAIGAGGGLLCAALKKKLNWPLIREASMETIKVTGKMLWIIIGAYAFKTIFAATGGVLVISELVAALHVGPWVFFGIVIVTYLIMGCIMDEMSMLLITFPAFIPLLQSMGFDMIWFGVVFLMVAEISALTPPFGFALFLMKSVAPKQISLRDIWGSIWPFVGCQIVLLILIIIFPQIVLWLPSIRNM